jgi:outer membrane immunogenic protein
MRKVLVSGILASGAAMMAVPANAQDDSPFTGLRIEALGGYDILRNGSGVDIDEDGGDDVDESIEGFLYGAGVGFDFDLGGFVAGVEGEISDSTGNQEADEVINAPFAFRASVGRDLYIGGRVGMRVAPTTLVYVKGGYTSAKIDAAVDDLDPDDDVDFTTDADQTVDGYRIGAGIEHAFGNSFGFGSGAYAKVEYRYSNYDDLSFDDDFFTAPNSVEVDLDRHQVVAGLGIRF